jgi:cation transport regulator ChaC
LAQKFSVIFDIDMTEKYSEFINLYKEEVDLLNHSLSKLIDMATEHLYTEKSLCHILDILEDNFIFDLNIDESVAEIAELYSSEFKKLENK